MNKHSVASYSTGTDRCTNIISFIKPAKISAMFQPNIWSKRWAKHVAVCCVFKLISVYVCTYVGYIVLQIHLTHGSCIIQMKLPLHSKPKSSPSQQPDSNVINGSELLSSWKS